MATNMEHASHSCKQEKISDASLSKQPFINGAVPSAWTKKPSIQPSEHYKRHTLPLGDDILHEKMMGLSMTEFDQMEGAVRLEQPHPFAPTVKTSVDEEVDSLKDTDTKVKVAPTIMAPGSSYRVAASAPRRKSSFPTQLTNGVKHMRSLTHNTMVVSPSAYSQSPIMMPVHSGPYMYMPYAQTSPMPWLWTTSMAPSPTISSPHLSPVHHHHTGAAYRDNVDDVVLSEEDYESDLLQMIKEFCLPLPEEKAQHNSLYEAIHSILLTHFPNAKLERFGSTENGFSLRSADLDFCVIIPPKLSDKLEDQIHFVNLFGDVLRKEPRFTQVKILSRARIPIIKLKDSVTGISCDIGVNNILALYNTRLLRVYGEIDARLVQLALLVKFWAKRREVNDPYWGTLSSYCYLMMAIFYLQKCHPPLLPVLQQFDEKDVESEEDVLLLEVDGCTVRFLCSPKHSWPSQLPTLSLSSLVSGFFHFYAHEFSYSTRVISIRTGTLLSKESKQWTIDQNSIKGSYWFCVEDPFDTGRNLARTVSKNR